ncbi:N-acetylmuramoyl-L-alanine amidase [Saccharothrix stipae]
MPYSSPRPPGVRPSLLVPHTGEGIIRRHDMAAYLNNNPNASAHAVSDAGGLLSDLVPDERAAWTAGPTGNARGLHIEQCAFVALSRTQWLSEQDVTVYVPHLKATRLIPSPMSMLRHTAAWLRAKSARWGIPLVKLSPSEVRAGKSGVCGHGDISLAWGETDHTDPQPNYPWDVVLDLARGGTNQKDEDDDMPRVTTGEWSPGEHAQHLVTFPTVGDAGFFGIATGWKDAKIEGLLFIGAGRKYLGGPPAFTLRSDDRRWWKLPAGCDQVSIQYTSERPIAYSVELG